MQVQFWAATDVGLTRDHNEDNYLVDPNLSLFVVADGMGGHAAGEIASSVAVHEVREAIKQQKEVIEGFRRSGSVLQRQTVLTLLEQAILTACKSVYQCAQEDSERHGMGTTLSLMLLARNRAFIGHVGDSRIYRMREGKITQITEDHTVINELIKSGRIKPNEAFNSPYKNAVTRAVGVHPAVEVDTFDFPVQEQDRYLLCSDGLSGYLDENPKPFKYLEGDEVKEIPQALIDFANESGGKDNITAIVIRVDQVDQPQLTTNFGILPPLPNLSSQKEEQDHDLDELDELDEESLMGANTDEFTPPPLPQTPPSTHQKKAFKIKAIQGNSADENVLNDLPIHLLKVSPLFALLSDLALESLVSLADLVEIEQGASLSLKGAQDDSLYFLYSGELRLEDDEQELGLIVVGSTFGEEQLLQSQTQSHHIIAQQDSKLFRWRQEALQLLMAKSPELASRLMWGVATFHQQKALRVQRSLMMLEELYTQTLKQYLPEDHPLHQVWQEQSQTIVKTMPKMNEVHNGLSPQPLFIRDLPDMPSLTFDLSVDEAQAALEEHDD